MTLLDTFSVVYIYFYNIFQSNIEKFRHKEAEIGPVPQNCIQAD